jgi:hypothetical protein
MGDPRAVAFFSVKVPRDERGPYDAARTTETLNTNPSFQAKHTGPLA